MEDSEQKSDLFQRQTAAYHKAVGIIGRKMDKTTDDFSSGKINPEKAQEEMADLVRKDERVKSFAGRNRIR